MLTKTIIEPFRIKSVEAPFVGPRVKNARNCCAPRITTCFCFRRT